MISKTDLHDDVFVDMSIAFSLNELLFTQIKTLLAAAIKCLSRGFRQMTSPCWQSNITWKFWLWAMIQFLLARLHILLCVVLFW